MDGELIRTGGRWTLRFERNLSHPVERVWRALTEPSELAGWFPGQVRMELVPGGKIDFAQPGFDIDAELLKTHGTVTQVDPPRLLAFTWGDDPLRFELTPDGAGCRLVFTHQFENRAGATRFAAGWSVCLDLLPGVLAPPGGAGESGGSGTGWADYYTGYAEELGCEGTVSREGDAAVLRFERVLEHPVERVWDALTTPDLLRGWLADARLAATECSPVELRFAHPPGYVVTGTVVRSDPPRAFEYTWTGSGEPDGRVKWQLIPAGDRCILLFTHTVHGHWDSAGTLAAWHIHLALLANALAGHGDWRFPSARWEELHQSYREATPPGA